MQRRSLALAAAAVLVAGSAQAVVFNGTTVDGPTFNRPLDPQPGLSGVGTAVPYSIYQFTVTAPGSYTFLLTSTTTDYDPFAALYGSPFNPLSPLTNLLVVNDDLGSSLTASGFSFTLATATPYVFVATGFNNLDFGTFTASIIGPGTVVPVPEPGSYGLMALGLGLVGAAARRRRSAND